MVFWRHRVVKGGIHPRCVKSISSVLSTAFNV